MDKQGLNTHKLSLVSLPEDYVIPPGMILSWRTVVHVSHPHQLEELETPLEPVEAYFYLGRAFGTIERIGYETVESGRKEYPAGYGARILRVTIQGTHAPDVMMLRDHLMHLVNAGLRWKVRNDLNPSSWKTFFDRLKKKIGLALKLNPI
jgi:hypothetical protein